MADFPIDRVRARFPGLAREVDGRPAVFLDGPAGSQVPQRVVDAVAHYLLHDNANVGGTFPTTRATSALLDATRAALADLVGAADPREVVFGANMTSLTYQLSRALARTWAAGDEVVVTRLDHDANVTPWLQAAADAGVRARHVAIRAADCTLDLDDLDRQLSPRTRLVAIGAASNLVGTCNPVAEIVARAHAVGAEVFVDAVHHAPHRRIDVAAWGCDWLACSAYKFFGPHVGVLWGRADRLAELPEPHLRPVPDTVPNRWLHGTQNHEGLAGTLAAVDYLADLGRELGAGDAARPVALDAAYAAIEAHESALCRDLLAGLAAIPGLRVWGIADPERVDERAPTVSFTHARHAPAALAAHLAERGFFCWAGNSYAVPLTEALGLEPDGVVRVGLLHYNSAAEVERLLAELRSV